MRLVNMKKRKKPTKKYANSAAIMEQTGRIGKYHATRGKKGLY